MAAADVDAAIAAIRAGKPVLLPADGVYGLCTTPGNEDAVVALYALKGRPSDQPSAVIAASVPALLELVPELARFEHLLTAILPGAYTLVLPNPARRFPWLNGVTPDVIGVRVAKLPPVTQSVLDQVGAVVATSANDPGEPSPARLEDIPPRVRSACAAEIDAGLLPGIASTVVDLSGEDPIVLREGAGSVDAVLTAHRTTMDGVHG